MCQHFREVFSLCQYVLEDSRNEKLIYCTLETLLRFLNWIPLGYIFETGLINALIFKVCVKRKKIPRYQLFNCFFSSDF